MELYIYAIYILYVMIFPMFLFKNMALPVAMAQVSSGATVETWHFSAQPWQMQLEQLAKAFEARRFVGRSTGWFIDSGECNSYGRY